MTEKEMRDWIDNSTYKVLLRKWRFAPFGSEFFSGDVGDYYVEVMEKKKSELPDNGVAVSKQIGWEG